MDVIEAIETRRSCHNFIPDRTISRETIERLIELACLAPSSFNLQPWKFLVILDEERRQKIREISYNQKQASESSALVIVLADTRPERYAEEIFANWVEQGYYTPDRAEKSLSGLQYAYGTDEARVAYAMRNSSFAAQNLMLAAHGMGLATCPMIGFDKKKLTEYLGVGDGWVISFYIALGYPSGKEKERLARLPLERVLAFETLE
ncbi:MAG: nitroreductase family protein [Deltaproteobacteria bacterium]|nr:nitroreductase family protein [bacterium]MCB9477601.1 nitroreductase family protein [Deltaproteobacteria bacterium]MCB9487496.1 nitroreductase family protein [Deltaproteobacteria bacterium]